MTQQESADEGPAEVPGTQEKDRPAIIGIGGCATGVQSLELLFSTLPRRLPASYVIALKQIEILDLPALLDGLRRDGGPLVQMAENGLVPLAGTAYVVPAGTLAVLEDGRLSLRPANRPPAERALVDSLLASLAEEAKDGAVGVLLTGLGPNGAAGLHALRENGGLVIAEAEPERREAPHPMVDPAGLADFLLPAEQIGERIAAHLRHREARARTRSFETLKSAAGEQLNRIATILRNKTGHDFHGYKQNTFLRRIQRRLQVLQMADIESYAEFLRTDPHEVGYLFQDLLIGVTQFFRDPAEFELLERDVIPRLFEGKGAGDHLRIWVLGCTTGEEAYSIAILLREKMARMESAPQVQIFATDIDGRALTLARAGRYSSAIESDITPERLARWFVKEGSTYCVGKELREMCIFSQHNVIKDAPFSRIDLVSCRNLLIYLTSALQDRVIPLFHFSLRPGGFLFLGPAENVTRHSKLFAPVDRRHRIFRRQDSTPGIPREFPLNAPRAERPAAARPGFEGRLGSQVDRIAERYAPAYVVIDETYDVLHFSGRTGRFLEPAAGMATLNLLNLIHRDLRFDLRAALHTAAAERRMVKAERIAIASGEEPRLADIIVEPVLSEANIGYVVFFQDGGPAETDAQPQVSATVMRDEHVQRLEAELRLTKERLQATIEELESTNEELKSSNEEYQSINEELQSANEELETSKEELQSVNEELQTVNGELGHRVAELARANSDLKNLLESTQIATVFLDNDLRIKSFTPSATEIFHLIETDIGRPINHIASRILYPEMQDDVRRVLRTLGAIERRVGDGETGGARYLLRVLPYRSIDNFIAGTVLTFLDVSATHRAEAEAEAATRQRAEIIESISDAFYALDAQNRFTYANRRALELWGRREEDVLGRILPEVFPQLLGSDAWNAQLKVATERVPAQIETHSPMIGRWLSMSIYPSTSGLSVFFRDMTEKRQAEIELWKAREGLEIALDAVEMGTWDMDMAEGMLRRSPRLDQILGSADSPEAWSLAELLGYVSPEDRGIFETAFAEAGDRGRLSAEGRISRAGGEIRWVQMQGRLHAENGGPARMAGVIQDITARKRTEERQKLLVAELQHRVKNILAVVRSIAIRTRETASSLEDFALHFDGRLSALARTQGTLARMGTDGIQLEELVRDELLSHAARDDEQLTIDGPAVMLKDKAAEIMALALHELAVNAVKYGALSQPNGRVRVEWKLLEASEGRRLLLDWRETGVRLIDANPRRMGFGRDLLERGLPYDLGAATSLSFIPGGVHCLVEIPLSQRIQPGLEAEERVS